MSTTIRTAVQEDAAAIAAIYNQGIAARGATFDTEPRTAEDIQLRMKHAERFPLLVAERAGTVIGWAGLSSYRPRACYAGIGEFSIYLDRGARGRGVGRQLLDALIDAARERGYWKLVSRIFPFNAASRSLCRACGFREVGVYEKHSQLDGQWMDVVIVERLIPENLGSATAAATSGSGHSALNALLDLAQLAELEPDTRIVWAIRRPVIGQLLGGARNDQLEERGKLGARVRRLLEEKKLEVLTAFPNGRIARQQQLARAAGPLAVAWTASLASYEAVFAGLAVSFSAIAIAWRGVSGRAPDTRKEAA